MRRSTMRRAFLLSTAGLAQRHMYGQWSTPLLLVTTREAAALRERMSDAHRVELRSLADTALKAGPRSDDNHRDIGNLGSAVLALGMGAYLLKDERYARHAAKILTTWFVDPKTRMNIHAGRGTSIIDTVPLIYAVQGMALLDQSGSFDKDVMTALRQWFRDYLHWLMTSQKGRDEAKSGNNHATWWAAQVAAYAGFAGDRATLDMAWDHFRKYLVPTQIRPDGSCPREEARTQSLSYSTYNLDAFSVICRLAQLQGADLWHFRGPNGVSVEKAVAYVMPYVAHPETWHKPQITPFEADHIVFPGLAAVGLESQELLTAYKALPRAQTAGVLLVDLIVRGA